MNLQEEIGILKEQLEAEKAARLQAEQLLKEKSAELERLALFQGWFASLPDESVVQKKLQEQRAFFEEILNKTPADIIVVDTQYRYLFVNPSAVADEELRKWMIGKTNEEFCTYAGSGRTEKIAQARRDVFQRALLTRRMVEWEEESMDVQGEIQHYLRKVYPVPDETGEIQWVIIYAVNITERRVFEGQLQLSEKRYRDLFSYNQAMICTHDMEGRLMDVNPEVARTVGYTDEELIGQEIQYFIPPEHKAKFKDEYIKAIQEKNKVSGVLCLMSKEGERIFLLYQNYRVEEPGMEPYVISSCQNITDRIRMEKELRLAKQETDEGARAKESFLAHMSHEIRTPLSGMLGVASLLRKTKLDTLQSNYLHLIQEAAGNLLVIVNDILDLEKIIAGKLQLERISFRIVDKLSMTTQSFIYRAEEKELGLIFQNSIPGDLVVKGDPYRLSQVLNNILNNALKFTESGHITIVSAIRERNEDSVLVEITISDTGIGISDARIKSIFEPFEQADVSISRRYGGTGLGLTICKNMIELQNGEMEVQSKEGKGSAFTIRIPYQLSRELIMPENEPVQEIDYKSLGRKKILVAEDVELNQYVARHILESWNFEVVIANNGNQALDLLARESFDCILMDVQMPEMDGIEATQHIRRLPDPVKSSIPIIALTANALKGDSEKYIAAGMSDYLAKPFDEARLFMVISRNLARYESQVHAGPAGSGTAAAVGAGQAATGNEFYEQPQKHNNMSSDNEKLYDLSMVQSVSGGDEAFIKKMVNLFIETVPQNWQEMSRATQAENWEQVGKTAHKLKSTLDSMGIKSVRQDIRTVETNARQKESLEVIPALVERIGQVIDDCIAQLQDQILK